MMGILGHVEGNRAIISNSMLSSSLYVSLTLVLLLNSISLMCVWIWILSSRIVISILRLPTRSTEALAVDKTRPLTVLRIFAKICRIFFLCVYIWTIIKRYQAILNLPVYRLFSSEGHLIVISLKVGNFFLSNFLRFCQIASKNCEVLFGSHRYMLLVFEYNFPMLLVIKVL